jgi:hypothetical protein
LWGARKAPYPKLVAWKSGVWTVRWLVRTEALGRRDDLAREKELTAAGERHAAELPDVVQRRGRAAQLEWKECSSLYISDTLSGTTWRCAHAVVAYIQHTHITHINQQIISLSALARAQYRRSIGTRTGAQISAAN